MKKSKKLLELDAVLRQRASEKARQKQADEASSGAVGDKTPEHGQKNREPQFDWPNITGADFDKEVGPYLAELGDTAKRILYLHKLWVEGREASDNHLETFYTTYYDREGRPISTLVRGKPEEFIARRNQFFRRLRARLEKLYALQKIEEADEAQLKSQAAKESEPKRGKPEFSAVQCCLFLHYLLHAAEYAPDKEKDATVKYLLVAMTGLDESAIRKKWDEMFSRNEQTPKDLRFLKPYFEKLGLLRIAALIEEELSDRKNDDDDF